MDGSSVIHILSSLPSQAWWVVAILAGLMLLGGGGKKKKRQKKKDEGGSLALVVVVGVVLLAAGTGGGAFKIPVVHHAVTSVISSGPANEKLADKMAAKRGWGSSEQGCLNQLWNRETGGTWDTHITDPIVVSGHLAYGIAQAVGHDDGNHAVVTYEKFLNGSTTRGVTVDDYPSTAANAGDARSQIAWGLGYIQSAYGTPCAAWNYEVTHSGY